ncbi:hypothetical protein K1T71_001376 [Dendrolimus kikuchii]|uniref:Uncharacterized protein n=1 Tax=Dendrolimus kikuchii TaxID=765133 RepID=A0ACC1DHY3_9NEOP|nr:hypothetical protein K1T71_001376 [Dendrolimus kikuchii]
MVVIHTGYKICDQILHKDIRNHNIFTTIHKRLKREKSIAFADRGDAMITSAMQLVVADTQEAVEKTIQQHIRV